MSLPTLSSACTPPTLTLILTPNLTLILTLTRPIAWQDMGYHIETVHTKLPSLLDSDGWSSVLRDRSVTTRVLFREDSDPSLQGACYVQMLRHDCPPM